MRGATPGEGQTLKRLTLPRSGFTPGEEEEEVVLRVVRGVCRGLTVGSRMREKDREGKISFHPVFLFFKYRKARTHQRKIF